MQAELLQARAHESDAHIARLAQERDAGRFTSTKVQILAQSPAQKYKYGRTLRASHKSETPVLAHKYKCRRFTSTKVQILTHIARARIKARLKYASC
jgi:hypothetical protein